jgi:hypothetical protein
MTLSFGAEHEWADFPLDGVFPYGFKHNKKDHTVVNSNGIANDPSGRLYKFGGEINSPPTDSIGDQLDITERLIDYLDMAKVNYRSNLHIHLRVPGLRDDLAMLKQVQRYTHTNMPAALQLIEPIPKPSHRDKQFENHFQAYEGALRRYKRRCVSHHTLLTPKRLAYQLEARTCDEFFRLEVPAAPNGRVLWHLQPRLCVSLRQMLETDTIEFRHWPGTLDIDELSTCFQWCKRFIIAAMNDRPILDLLAWARKQTFPKFPDYVHWMELRYRATVHDGSLSKDEIKRNIARILDGKFDEHGIGESLP